MVATVVEDFRLVGEGGQEVAVGEWEDPVLETKTAAATERTQAVVVQSTTVTLRARIKTATLRRRTTILRTTARRSKRLPLRLVVRTGRDCYPPLRSPSRHNNR